MATIKIDHLTKSFGDTEVLKDINLEIREGEFLTLVGASGSGKSTLLRIIAGLEHKTSGEIYIDGQPVTQKRPKERDLAMVFQNYALYPHMTVQQNMQVPLRMKGNFIQRLPLPSILKSTKTRTWLTNINDRVAEVAEQLQISHLLARKPSELSGGQCQRVALGRAMVRDPKAFLMDEPLSNLDAKLRVHMRSELSQLHRQLQTTFIYVTHDQVEAMTMSDRIALLVNGSLIQVDDPVSMYDNPSHLEVAEFIGSPKINTLPAQIAEDKTITYANQSTNFTTETTTDSKSLLLAIRPEYLTIDENSKLSAEVIYVENMGSEFIIHAKADWARGELNIKIQHSLIDKAPIVGKIIRISIRENKFLCFSENGERLPLTTLHSQSEQKVA